MGGQKNKGGGKTRKYGYAHELKQNEQQLMIGHESALQCSSSTLFRPGQINWKGGDQITFGICQYFERFRRWEYSVCNFFYLQVIRNSLILWFLPLHFLSSLNRCQQIRKLLRVSNLPCTVFLDSLFLSHTFVKEHAILFEKKQQEQDNTSHATITIRIHSMKGTKDTFRYVA